MIRLALPVIALAVAGCTYGERPEAGVPGVECSANGLEKLIGQKRGERVAARAKRLSGANAVRWLEPGAVVTMEFRADRLNLNLDKNGRITSARCG